MPLFNKYLLLLEKAENKFQRGRGQTYFFKKKDCTFIYQSFPREEERQKIIPSQIIIYSYYASHYAAITTASELVAFGPNDGFR